MNLRKLTELPPGGTGVVRHCPATGGPFLRLREMGLLPGTSVTLVRTAPLGGPLEIRLRGYRLTLRRSEAEHVAVEAA